MGKQFIVPGLPPELYKNPNRSGLAASGSMKTRMIKQIEMPEEGGLLVWFDDLKYPRKGAITPEGVMVMVCVKRALFSLARFAASSPVRYFVGLTMFLPPFMQRRIWKSFFEFVIKKFAYHVFEPHLLNAKGWCRTGRELYRVGEEMARRYPAWKEEIMILTEIVCGILEYDNAWRYRIQDILGMIRKDAFRLDPLQEILRVLKIARSRERTYKNEVQPDFVHERYTSFLKIAQWAFRLRPSLKRLALEIVSELDQVEAGLDEADIYFCLTRPDYDILDKNFEERTRIRLEIDATKTDDERDQAMKRLCLQWSEYVCPHGVSATEERVCEVCLAEDSVLHDPT